MIGSYATILTIMFSFLPNVAEWRRVVINNEISVEFPRLPIQKSSGDKEMYLYKTVDYALMVGVANDAFSKYTTEINEKSFSRDEAINRFLDDVVDDKLSSLEYSDGSVASLKLGSCFGREICYLSKSKISNDKRRRFAILLVVNDRLYSFDCWYLKPTLKTDVKERFFKSILVKE